MKITSRTAAMAILPLPNTPTDSSTEKLVERKVRYTNTGFGQLPVIDHVTEKPSPFRSHRFQIFLLILALILSLIGILYILIFLGNTYLKYIINTICTQ